MCLPNVLVSFKADLKKRKTIRIDVCQSDVGVAVSSSPRGNLVQFHCEIYC